MINKFSVGDKVVFSRSGIFGWEEIDESEQGDYHIGNNTYEVTEVDYTKGEEGIKLDFSNQWVHPNHFELAHYAKGGSVNTGRSWHLDRQKSNKSESWEKPMNKRKQRYDDGGNVLTEGEVFHENPLFIKRLSNGFLDFDFDFNRSTGWAFSTDDVGVAVAVITGSHFKDNSEIRNIEITPKQLRLSDKKDIVYWLSGGNKAWMHSETYLHDFNKTYDDLWVKDALKLKKSIQKFKTIGELLDFYKKEYLDYPYFYGDATDNGYNYDSEMEEEKEAERIRLEEEEERNKNDDYINQYASENYTSKQESEVISDLVNYFEQNNIEYDYDRIEEVVYDYYNTVGSKSLKLFRKGGGINSGRDLLFKSKQPHEQKYQRKTEWKEYNKEGWFGDWFANGGGVGSIISEIKMKYPNLKVESYNNDADISVRGKNKNAIYKLQEQYGGDVMEDYETDELVLEFSVNSYAKKYRKLNYFDNESLMRGVIKKKYAEGGGVDSIISEIKMKYPSLKVESYNNGADISVRGKIKNSIYKLQEQYGGDVMEDYETDDLVLEFSVNSYYAKGGRVPRNVGRDWLFKSKQPHEQKYERKTEWKEYNKEGWFGDWFANGGGVGDEKVLRYRNKLVQMNVGKNEPSLDFAIKIIDMLVDGELVVSKSKDKEKQDQKSLKSILRHRNKLVQINVGKNEPSLDFAIKIIDMLVDGELIVKYANGGGVDGVIVYDNDGETFDRYTIFTPDGSVYGMSDNALMPNGFNQYLGDNTEVEKGSHLGKKLKSIPESIKVAVQRRMSEYKNGGGVSEYKRYSNEDDLLKDAFNNFNELTGVLFNELDFVSTESYSTADYYISKDSSKEKVERVLKLIGRDDDYNSIALVVNKNFLWGASKYSLSLMSSYKSNGSVKKTQSFFIYPYYQNKYGEVKGGLKYANGGGVEETFDYGGTTMTDEAIVRDNIVNGEIDCDTLTEIIGRKPNYPHQIVGALKLEKCYLKPYYRIA